MDHIKEFMEGFACRPPEYLPEALKSRLTFLSCLSHKGTREVYLIMDNETRNKAILKITGLNSADSVKREYELLGKLDHPAIPKAVFYCEDEAKREYLIREYIPGDTLNYLLERDGVFDARTALALTKKLCGILSYLHHQTPPIIYRDIKPQNIVLTPNGKVSLIDFGISREDKSDKSFDTIYVGSAAFAAPELYGFTKSDSRTDIFALGKLMLYLHTGTANQQEAIGKVEIKALSGLIKKCTQLSPEKRFASVEKLSRAIDRILHPLTGFELAVSMGAAALCIVVGLFIWTHMNKAEPDVQEASLVNAGGAGYEQEVKVPVQITTLWNGQPFSDCAVAIDNHYWYEPAQNGKAELYAFAYDEYKIRAVTGNRTAFALSPVTKETGPLSFTFDLAKVPEAPEYLSLSLAYGQAHEVPLGISGANAVTFAERPDGVSVEKRGDAFFLLISGDVETPGHYYLYAEVANDEGKADMAISLWLTEEEPITVITTAEELDGIRENLTGRYALGADIDLSGIESWTPIGSGGAPFTGEFDGRGLSITGFRIQGKQSLQHGESGLFGAISHGIVRNTVMRGGNLYTALASGTGNHGFLVGRNMGGLIENCAVFDSEIRADIGLESGAGGICGSNLGIIRNCWSEARVTIFTASSKNWTESCAGGICGTNSGYLSDCGNAGDITGISLAGGVVGFNDMGILTRCYNAGYVQAPAYFTTYLAGGISHMLGRGKIISYCAFEEGTAQVGSSVFNGGTLLKIEPVVREGFRDLDALHDILRIASGDGGFAFASMDSYYPLPAGIFASQTEAPVLEASGGDVKVSPISGVKYFYTTDGSDPHATLPEGVDSIDLTLAGGESIKVFAARSGALDSEIVEYKFAP